MKDLFLSRKFRTIKVLLILFIFIEMVGTGNFTFAENTTIKRERRAAHNSVAWQMEELMKWLMKTRNLEPAKTEGFPNFVINTLELSGTIEKNRLAFKMNGRVIADHPVLIPLFGSPETVMLRNVTINEKPAVVGFESKTFYYVRTGENRFTIKGELSLLNCLDFMVQGPVNLLIAEFTDGRVVEGGILPGLTKAVLHLETGNKKMKKAALAPLFQVSRAIRIRKEITFEYKVTVRSGKEISKVEIPMKYSEVVLDVPGVKGWKMENRILMVPASGRNVNFTVVGRLPKLGRFKTDARSNYEWWLIESDEEHRLIIDTKAKFVDSSRSPLKKKLS
ncbi:MAG: hypothetical protein GY757_00485, partial [bacterium]|nr:hypothetical protein [bacterium]